MPAGQKGTKAYEALNELIGSEQYACKLNLIRARAENMRMFGHISKEQLRDLKKKITQRKRKALKEELPECLKEG